MAEKDSKVQAYEKELHALSQYAAQSKVNEVLKTLLEDLFVEKPADPVQWMIAYLIKYKAEHPSDTAAEEQDAVAPLAPFKPYDRKRRRTAVSAEPGGFLNDAAPTPVYEKTPEQRERILAAISDNILFRSLDKETLEMVVNGMFEKRFDASQDIITQGDEGDHFYILEEGECQCFLTREGSTTMVKEYSRGESFGELALMYNCPRAASIRAKTACVVWGMDRLTFRKGVMQFTKRKREKFEDFLAKLDILKSLAKYERSKVADALVETHYADNEYVIRQGEDGHEFYIILEGEAKATKKYVEGGEEHFLCSYKTGDFFGELALLSNTPRAANVQAVSDLTCIHLERETFTRLLGPCEEILKRNQENYDIIDARNRRENINAISGGEVVGVEGSTPRPRRRRTRRAGISAEPTKNMEEDLADHPAVVHPKTDEQVQQIHAVISKNILFMNMSSEDEKMIIDSMFEKRHQPGEVIIQQGDAGDFFYVLGSGICDCYFEPPNEDPVLVKTYNKGGAFGELALMYNAPRAATIKARTEVSLWAMDRISFRRTLMQSTSRKRRMYEGFLQSVPILSGLSPSERSKISDALEEISYNDGDFVLTQGEQGDKFYIVAEGEAIVRKRLSADSDPVEVMHYQKGSYFGEIALMKNQSRSADVIAKGPLKCVYLDRGAFERMLGPVHELMARNLTEYEKADEAALGR